MDIILILYTYNNNDRFSSVDYPESVVPISSSKQSQFVSQGSISHRVANGVAEKKSCDIDIFL